MATGQVVTTKGKIIALNRIFKSTPDYTSPTKFRVGMGTTTPALSDTDLQNKVGISGLEIVDTCDVTTGWTANADLTLSVNSSTFKTSVGALNWTKAGTATANANADKATTTLDFTGKELTVWVNVNDSATLAKFATTNCFTLRFGSDSGNYYQWQKNASFFAVGWNLVNGLTTGTATTTGAPVTTACDYTFVQITSTAAGDTWTSGKVIVDDIKLVSSADYDKAMEVGYPILDETALSSEIKCILSLTDAEGTPLTEFGLTNTDGTIKLFSRSVHTVINKTQSIQVNYLEKDKVSPSP